MLLGKHLGLRGSVRKLLEAHDVRAEEVAQRVAALQDAAVARGWIAAGGGLPVLPRHRPGRAAWCSSTRTARSSPSLPFAPPAEARPYACAADWVSPRRLADHDAVALLVTTARPGVRERATELQRDRQLRSTPSPCRPWPSRPPRRPPSGCTGGCARCGASPTRPR